MWRGKCGGFFVGVGWDQRTLSTPDDDEEEEEEEEEEEASACGSLFAVCVFVFVCVCVLEANPVRSVETLSFISVVVVVFLSTFLVSFFFNGEAKMEVRRVEAKMRRRREDNKEKDFIVATSKKCMKSNLSREVKKIFLKLKYVR
jgi:hypothetical protein